jgi:hypothetical protein
VDVQLFGDGEALLPYGFMLGMRSLQVEPEETVWKSHPLHLKIGRADVCDTWLERACRLSSYNTHSHSLLDFWIHAVCCA